MRSRRHLVALALAGAVLLAGFVWALLVPADEAIDPDDPDQVALGRAVYAEHCASCHGADLAGEADWRNRKPNGRMPAPPHDVTGHTWHHSDAMLFAITKDGIAAFAPPGYESDMPAFGPVLADAEIRAVLAYIKSRWPEEIRRRQAAIEARNLP